MEHGTLVWGPGKNNDGREVGILDVLRGMGGAVTQKIEKIRGKRK